jgi:hypothetical protein
LLCRFQVWIRTCIFYKNLKYLRFYLFIWIHKICFLKIEFSRKKKKHELTMMVRLRNLIKRKDYFVDFSSPLSRLLSILFHAGITLEPLQFSRVLSTLIDHSPNKRSDDLLSWRLFKPWIISSILGCQCLPCRLF